MGLASNNTTAARQEDVRALVGEVDSNSTHRTQAAPATAGTVDRRTVLVATLALLLFMATSVATRQADGAPHSVTTPSTSGDIAPAGLPASSNGPIVPQQPQRGPPSAPSKGPNSARGAETHPTLALSDAVGRREWHRYVSDQVLVPEYQAAVKAHHEACLKAANASGRATTGLEVVGPARVSLAGPGWARLWIAAVVDGQRACRGGDVVEVSAEHADYLPRVDLPLDLGTGLYEVRFFARRGGEYRVCADWVVSYAGAPASSVAEFGARVAVVNDEYYQRLPSVKWERTVQRTELPNAEKQPHCSLGRTWANAKCSTFQINIPAAGQAAFDGAIAAQRKQHGPRCSHPDAFRSGAWVRMRNGECDGSACVGPLRVLESHGWVWASDWCVLRVHDPAAAWDVMGGKWLLAWGDSTLKQPVANFLEYNLRVPVFQVSMEQLHLVRAKKRPNFFSYRQYEVQRSRPASPNDHNATLVANPDAPTVAVSMAWGGCPNPGAPPGCADSGMKNRAYVATILDNHLKQGVLPAVIVLNHYIWRPLIYSTPAFLEQVEDTVTWLHAKLSGAVAASKVKGARMPLLVWATTTRRIVGSFRGPLCSAEDPAAFTDHDVLLTEHTLATKYPFIADAATRLKRPSVLIMSRYDLTYPFHYDDTYCHFGVHYGATRGMCLTGVDYKNAYELKKCLRETYPDGMFIQWWLNAIAAVDAEESR